MVGQRRISGGAVVAASSGRRGSVGFHPSEVVLGGGCVFVGRHGGGIDHGWRHPRSPFQSVEPPARDVAFEGGVTGHLLLDGPTCLVHGRARFGSRLRSRLVELVSDETGALPVEGTRIASRTDGNGLGVGWGSLVCHLWFSPCRSANPTNWSRLGKRSLGARRHSGDAAGFEGFGNGLSAWRFPLVVRFRWGPSPVDQWFGGPAPFVGRGPFLGLGSVGIQWRGASLERGRRDLVSESLPHQWPTHGR